MNDLSPIAPATAEKFDSAKVRLELLPFAALNEVGKVLTFGAGKYGPDNWRLGMNWRRLIGAALRHIFAFAGGESRDPETGICHLAHACCCLLFLLTYWLEKSGTDDRAAEFTPSSEAQAPQKPASGRERSRVRT